MSASSLYHTYKRFRSLQTDRISALPIVLLMPHSACNCRCVMCDIWQGNQQLNQLTEADVIEIISSLKKLGTSQVVFSGGEALLHQNFFRFCEILKKERMKVSLLSSGLTIKKYAVQLVEWVDEIILSLDGDENTHDLIRNIPNAFYKLAEGIAAVKAIDPSYKISARTVIHRLNFRNWPNIIDSAKRIGLDKISFLPADVSSQAFNRVINWGPERRDEILLQQDELPKLRSIVENILSGFINDIKAGYIVETPQKIENIYFYYAAFYGYNKFPWKKCNAPWVSAVVEADGTVRPCFFHEAYGNVKTASLDKIINSQKAIEFRKQLDIAKNETCKKCVCYLNLRPGILAAP